MRDGWRHESQDQEGNDEFEDLGEQDVEGLEDTYNDFRGDQPQQGAAADGDEYLEEKTRFEFFHGGKVSCVKIGKKCDICLYECPSPIPSLYDAIL